MSEDVDDSPGVVDPRLRASFAVLRRPQTRLEREQAPDLVPPMVERFGLLTGESRMVAISDSERVWITPGTSGVAFSTQVSPFQGRGGTFMPIEKAVAHGLGVESEHLDGSRWLWKLLPDGNEMITVEYTDGRSATVPTVDNAFVIDLEGVRAIHYTDTHGAPREENC